MKLHLATIVVLSPLNVACPGWASNIETRPPVAVKPAKSEAKPTVNSKLPSQTTSKTSKAPSTRASSNRRAPAPRRLLVPPPPPNVPTISTYQQQRSGESLLSGVILEYLSKTELERLQKRLEQSLAKERKAADERAADFEEKKAKASEFEKLFAEGVVSRKELSNAKREYEQVQEQKQELVDKSAEMQSDLERVNKQLRAAGGSQKAKTPSKTK